MAAGPSVDPGRWLGVPDELMTRIGGRFRRVEPRRRARASILKAMNQAVTRLYVREDTGDGDSQAA